MLCNIEILTTPTSHQEAEVVLPELGFQAMVGSRTLVQDVDQERVSLAGGQVIHVAAIAV